MILQIGRKGTDNMILLESKTIESFSVGDLKSSMIHPDSTSNDEEIQRRNYDTVKAEIAKAGSCRDNIVWYLGGRKLEENDNLVAVTTDDETYVFSIIGCDDRNVFILNNSGKTISRIL